METPSARAVSSRHAPKCARASLFQKLSRIPCAAKRRKQMSSFPCTAQRNKFNCFPELQRPQGHPREPPDEAQTVVDCTRAKTTVLLDSATRCDFVLIETPRHVEPHTWPAKITFLTRCLGSAVRQRTRAGESRSLLTLAIVDPLESPWVNDRPAIRRFIRHYCFHQSRTIVKETSGINNDLNKTV